MTIRHGIGGLVVAVSLAACGASEAARHTTTPAEGKAYQEQPAGKTEPERGVPYGGNPLLTVYVQGPETTGSIDAAAGVYETIITVVNTGAAPARLGLAQPSFEVWVDDERRACAIVEPIEAPSILHEGEAHTFVTRAECPVVVGEGQDVEVRTYVQLGLEGGSVDLERHYAGRFMVR